MKNFGKTVFAVTIIAAQVLCTTGNLIAQEENRYATINGGNQVGLRLGGYSGLSFRHWGARNLGYEISLMGWAPYRGMLASVMVEKNIPLNKGFAFYFGGGGFISNYDYRPYYYKFDGKWYAVEGGAPYFGLEGVI